MKLNVCPRCMAYMLEYEDPRMKGWRKCVSCGYTHDKDGKNLLTEPEESELGTGTDGSDE